MSRLPEATAKPCTVAATEHYVPLPTPQTVGRDREHDGDRGTHHYPQSANFTLTVDDTIVDATPAGAAMLGVPTSALPGLRFTDFVAGNDSPLFAQHREKILNANACHSCVIGLINNDGTHFLARLEGTPVQHDGGRSGLWRAVVTDLRNQIRGEAPLTDPAVPDRCFTAHTLTAHTAERDRRTGDTNVDAFERSPQSSALQTASVLAHELAQPLTAIMNYIEACRRTMEPCRGRIPDRAFVCADKAIHETSRAGQLLHRLRRLVEKGEAKRVEECINESIEAAAATMRERARETGVRVDVNLAPGLPPALVDALQIQQVIVNLVRNAIEALGNEPRRLIVIESAQRSPESIEIIVSDTGPGLSREVAARLFEPIASRKPQGMGVGLSISRAIIAAHGGKIWADSAPGQGTAFHFTLPIGR